MTHICKHYYVTGIVQGVFYRRHTYEFATKLGLTGWVKNLPDGRVELMACGEAAKVARLEEWLWEGPDTARVSNVEGEDVVLEKINKFTRFDVL